MWDCRGKGNCKEDWNQTSDLRLQAGTVSIVHNSQMCSGFKLNAHIVEFQRIHPEGKVYKFNQSLSSQIIIDVNQFLLRRSLVNIMNSLGYIIILKNIYLFGCIGFWL